MEENPGKVRGHRGFVITRASFAGIADHQTDPATRGRIEVLDRAGLEQRSCECYDVVKKEYDRLLPDRLSS